jgi:hypothetical protein
MSEIHTVRQRSGVSSSLSGGAVGLPASVDRMDLDAAPMA